MDQEQTIELDGHTLDLEKFRKIVFQKYKVTISEESLERVKKGRESIERLMTQGKSIYGVNTGFGSLLNKKIKPEEADLLQINLIRSHSSGYGEPLSYEKVRAILLVRINSLIRGQSGCTVDLVRKTVDILNSGIYIFVPGFGSVGSSGDLAPLSHLFLAFLGEGEIIENGKRVSADKIRTEYGIEPYRLREKEALAFINGTAAITGIGGVEVCRAMDNLKLATGSAIVAMDALSATKKAFRQWVLDARNQKGQGTVGKIIYDNLEGSKSVENADETKIQDAYTLRCTPQVYGAVLDTINYVSSVLVNEMNSTTDNPLVNDEEYISAGNFHGEPVALVCDFLAIAMVDLGNMIERRIARLTDTSLSGLPAFLIENSGLNSGYMIAQYAAAALCNRNKILVYPGSADSIPTCANQEDHVSMGANSANKLTEINNNIHRIISTEFVLAVQGLDLGKLEYADFSNKIRKIVRERVEFLERDRPVYRDMDTVEELMDSSLIRECNFSF